jgi:hypothetical protein
MEGKSTMIFVPTSSSNHAMPSLIGIEGIKDLLKTEKQLLSKEESD